jgi:hypothetical protein
MSSTKLLKHEELADRWQVTPRTLYRIGDLRRVKVGGSIRYRLQDVEAYEEKHAGTKWETR